MSLDNEKIKELYWNSKFTVDYIKQQSGLKLKDIILTAGKFETKCKCCGKDIVFNNRTERVGLSEYYLCESCRQLIYKIAKIASFAEGARFNTEWEWQQNLDGLAKAGSYVIEVGMDQAEMFYFELIKNLKDSLSVVLNRE